MRSEFKTRQRKYFLNTKKFTCNKFGIAEFFAEKFDELNCALPHRVLDAGCGVGPLGIFFADNYNCNVIGVELNPIAYECCKKNISELMLADRFKVLHYNIDCLAKELPETDFDLIVSNPPINDNITQELIQHFGNYDFLTIDSEAFAYLTNSWHDSDGS